MKITTKAHSDWAVINGVAEATIKIEVWVDGIKNIVNVYLNTAGVYETNGIVKDDYLLIQHVTQMLVVNDKVSTSTIITATRGDEQCTAFVNL